MDYKESCVPKNGCFWTVVLEKTLETHLDCKEIKSVNPKGNQSWIFIGRDDAEAEAEAPIPWPPDAKSQFIGKDPDAGKDWGQEEKGMAEDEMVGWHHRLNGHEFERAPGISDGQGRPGVLPSMGTQRVGHGWATGLSWTCAVLRHVRLSSVFVLYPPDSSVHGIFQARTLPSGLPFPPSGGLPNPGITPASPVSPALQQILYMLSPWGSPYWSSAIPIFQCFVCDSFSL